MYENEREIAARAARSAGEILKEKFGKVQHIVKKGAIDLVTEADLAAEEISLGMLENHFPKDNILSEEAGIREGSSGRNWIVYNPFMDEIFEARKGEGALLNGRPIHVFALSFPPISSVRASR